MKLLPDGDRQSEKRNILLPIPSLSASSLSFFKARNTPILPLQPPQENFTDIADDLDEQRISKTSRQFPLKKVCSYVPVTVPYVKLKSDGTFILKKRKVDLFRSEREANYLAQKLRHQIKRKKLAPKHVQTKKYLKFS